MLWLLPVNTEYFDLPANNQNNKVFVHHRRMSIKTAWL